MIYDNKLYNLNNPIGADYLLYGVVGMLRRKFDKEHLKCAEFGIAFGGGVEGIGKMLKGHAPGGTVWGFDTFDGHPEFLVKEENHAKLCMRRWYDNKYEGKWRIPHLTKEMLTYEYQRKKLDEQGLDNVILKKGLIDNNTDIGIDYLHYTLLDMDIPISMRAGYEIVKDKIVKGGFLALHDCNPKGHIDGLWELYQEILNSGQWKEIIHCDTSYLIVLEKI
jgi:hypothetical protein